MRGLIFLLAVGCVCRAETITGTISGPQGGLPIANVRARNVATGAVEETETSSTGAYSLTVTPGTFDIFVRKPAYGIVTKRDVAVASGKATKVDVTLTATGNNGVPGEQAYLLESERVAQVTGPVPKAANGKPDLSGMWLPSLDMDADAPAYRPWAAALQKERAEQQSKDDPRAHCLPSGVVRTNAVDLTKFIQIPTELIILAEGSPPGFRQIFLDGRGHPADFDPTWTGHSIGSWQDDTLVIDTVGFHDRGWIDVTGKPQTEQLHVIERMRRTTLGTLEIEITVDDPGAYERPWKLRRQLKLAPNEELHEYVCNENEKPEHLVGK
ncbi:MAG: carboxypeptidase-like regulatory domain-containing protein [Bryobacteraceae bacterium]